MSDRILEVLDHLSDTYIAEAALYQPASRWRKGLRLLLIAACCAALMTVGVAGWQIYLHLSLESDGIRRYSYFLQEEIPENAPAQVETVYLPDLSLLGGKHKIAWCGSEELSEGSYLYTVYRGSNFYQITVNQFPFAVFRQHTNKRASENYMAEEICTKELAGREVLCQMEQGKICVAIWTDGMYCYETYFTPGISGELLEKLILSFREEPDYATIAAAHPYYHPESGTLDSIVIPGFLPLEMGALQWEITPHYALWSIYDEAGYGVLFEQEPLDVWNYHTENGSIRPYYGGKILDWFCLNGNVIHVGEAGSFRDYLWYEEGDRCQLRFDKETGLDFDALAKRIIAEMTRTDEESAKTYYNSIS